MDSKDGWKGNSDGGEPKGEQSDNFYMKKYEFSKLIMVTAGLFNIAVIIFTCVMVWKTNDLSPLAYLIPSTAAEVATGTGFYYNKAKAENRLKLMKVYGLDINEKNFDEGGGNAYDRPYGNYSGSYSSASGSDYIVSDSVDSTEG